VALAPRLRFLRDPLVIAAAEAERAGVAFAVAGLSDCFRPDQVDACRVDNDQRGAAAPCGDRCPAPPDCEGIPASYLDLFGGSELTAPPVVEGQPALENLEGTSREVRMRLVRHSGRARILRITSLAHPEAAALLREAARLGFARVEVVADLAPMASFSDDELHRLRRLTVLTPVGRAPDGLLERIARIAPDVELPSQS
jgi:hypothetical protein